MIEEKDVEATAKIEAFIKEQGYTLRSSTFNKCPDCRGESVTVTVMFDKRIEYTVPLPPPSRVRKSSGKKG